MTTYYKAVRPDGTDFRSGKVNYLAGGTVAHPTPGVEGSTDAAGYLSVSVSATDCTGFSWPARLLEIEPVGPVWTPHASDMPDKRAVKALNVVRELDAMLLLGPQGIELLALVARARELTIDETRQLDAARVAAWVAAWDAARVAAWVAARDAARVAARVAARDAARDAAWFAARDAAWVAARDAARDAAWDAAAGLASRDLIGPGGFTQERYDLLTGPWRRVIGKIHAEDADMAVQS